MSSGIAHELGETTMKKTIELLESHFEEYPEEYREIARLKAYSKEIDRQIEKRKEERLKRVAEFRRAYEKSTK